MGLSAHKYIYYQNQNFNYLNENWIPDPVKTAVMSGVVSGGDPVAYVQNFLTTGNGYKFKQAYQYQTRRWKKRICDYYINHYNSNFHSGTYITGEYNKTLTNDNILSMFPRLRNLFWKVDEYFPYFTYSGSKFFEYIDKKYHLNDLTLEPDSEGRSFVITGLNKLHLAVKNKEDLSTSYEVGYETLGNKPLVILDPKVNEENILGEYYLLGKEVYRPEESKGAIVWVSNKKLQNVITEEEGNTTYTREAFNLLGMNINNLNKQEFNRIYLNPSSSSGSSSGLISVIYNPNDPDEDETEDIDLSDTDQVEIYYRQIKEIKANGDVVVSYFKETGDIIYDEIIYLWVDRNQRESHSGLKNYYSTVTETSVQNIYKPKMFKFYGSLPIKQDERWVINFSDGKAQKYLRALKKQDEISQENDAESDAPKADREGTRKDAKGKTNDKKLSGSDRQTLARKKYYYRKIKTNGIFGLDEKDHKHLDAYSDLLGFDYKDVAGNLQNDENQEYIYQACIFPSVRLSSNFDEENNYLWHYWDKIYKEFGQVSYDSFKSALDGCSDADLNYGMLRWLPHIEIGFNIDQEKIKTSVHFNYIKKFKLSGVRTRNTKGKRKRDLKEVRSGLLTPLFRLKGAALREALLNPSTEFIHVDYYESKAGKEYPVQEGGIWAPIPAEKQDFTFSADTTPIQPQRSDDWEATLHTAMYALHGYTFIVRPLNSHGDVEVIAIAGLVFRTFWTAFSEWNPASVSLEGRPVFTRAYLDLHMFYKRNRLKYVEHKLSGEEADVCWKFEEGSKKRKLDLRLRLMGYFPLDYKVLSRMNGQSVARLTPRCINILMHTRQVQKKLRGWVSIVLKIVGIVVAIIGAIYGDGGSTGMTIYALAEAIVYAVVIQIAIKYVLKLLIKVFGLKGFIALLVMIVICILAQYGGFFNNTSSTLPYASQTATNQIASNTIQQTVNSTVSQNLLESIKAGVNKAIENTMKQLADTSIKGILNTTNKVLDLANQGMQMYIQDEMKSMQDKFKEETEKFNSHMAELQELQEMNQELYQPYDIKVVMAALMNNQKLIEPDMYLQSLLLSDNSLASEAYLSQFIESKLNLDPNSFDAIRSIDFSLNYNNEV